MTLIYLIECSGPESDLPSKSFGGWALTARMVWIQIGLTVWNAPRILHVQSPLVGH